jgi:quinol monooxygenase YgiN
VGGLGAGDGGGPHVPRLALVVAPAWYRVAVRATHALVIGLAVVSAIGTAHAQEAAVYSVTYVEVVPTAAASTPSLLRRYCESTIRESGNLRCELLQRIGAPHQLVVLEFWKDRETFEAHGKTATLQDTRERISAIRNAPTDERVPNASQSVRSVRRPRGAPFTS